MKRRGFTLIESIVAITLIAIISAVLAFYILETVDAWTFLGGQKRIAMASSSALRKMVKELKRMNKSSTISTFSSKEVTLVNIYGSTITFSQEGTALYMNSDILLEDLDSSNGLILSYLDVDGNPTTNKEWIRTINIELKVVKGGNRFVIESASRIRVRRLRDL